MSEYLLSPCFFLPQLHGAASFEVAKIGSERRNHIRRESFLTFGGLGGIVFCESTLTQSVDQATVENFTFYFIFYKCMKI